MKIMKNKNKGNYFVDPIIETFILETNNKHIFVYLSEQEFEVIENYSDKTYNKLVYYSKFNSLRIIKSKQELFNYIIYRNDPILDSRIMYDPPKEDLLFKEFVNLLETNSKFKSDLMIILEKEILNEDNTN